MISTLRNSVVALVAVGLGLLVAAPAAHAKTGPVAATWKLPAGGYTLRTGLNAVWALNADESHAGQLYRLDPRTHALKLVATLPFPAGSMEIGYGSIWISDYFGNAVWRLAPDGHVQADIGVGLQPESIHSAFGSMWASNHHGASLSRISPISNTVTATIAAGAPDTFRNGPQSMTDDGTRLYVGSSNLQALQSVDPATNTVTTPPSLDDAFCGPMIATAGFVWSVDACTGATYQLNTDGALQQAFYPASGFSQALTTTSDDIWIGTDQTVDPDTGQGSDAVLQGREPSTGALLRTIALGGDIRDVESGFGSLWVYDNDANTIKRVDL